MRYTDINFESGKVSEIGEVMYLPLRMAGGSDN